MEADMEEMKADRESDKGEMLTRKDANMKSYQVKTEANRNTGSKELLVIMEAEREERRVGQETCERKSIPSGKKWRPQYNLCDQSWMIQSNIELNTFLRSLNTTNDISRKNYENLCDN
jgi:hypothetical protein